MIQIETNDVGLPQISGVIFFYPYRNVDCDYWGFCSVVRKEHRMISMMTYVGSGFSWSGGTDVHLTL